MSKHDRFAPFRAAYQAEAKKHDGPKYWRSLEHKAGVVDDDEQEFPSGTAELPELQRREVLKIAGASLALAGLSTACIRRPEEEILPYTHQPEEVVPGVALKYATAQPRSTGAVGLVVTAYEGRPVKIEGNPLHASSGGAADIWAQSEILRLFDPDRSRTPRKNMVTGHDKGHGENATWADWDTFQKAHFDGVGASGGKGVAFLVDGSEKPTVSRLLAQASSKWPNAKVYRWDPVSADRSEQGAAVVYGPGARVHHDLTKAAVVVALDSNFLVEGADSLKMAGAFGKGRKVKDKNDTAAMNRLYVVEGVFSVTGTNADHRLRLASSNIPAFLAAVASELGKLGVAVGDLPTGAAPAGSEAFAVAVAKDLAANRGKGVVVVGERQPAAVHAFAIALNAALGAGESQLQTVTSASGGAARASLSQSVQDLAAALTAGEIETLVVVDVNIAATAPGALGMGALLGKVKTLIHAGHIGDETADKSHWHLPLAHWLESWDDACAFDGTASIVQPLILPIFGARSPVALLGSIITGKGSDKELVEETWVAAGLTGKAWRKALHDGVIAAPASMGRAPAAAAAPQTAAIAAGLAASAAGLAKSSGTEIALTFGPVLDGRLGNLPWNQELPDSMTKLCWDNALVVSPALAKEMGIKSRVNRNEYTSDIVTIDVDGQKLDAPTFVLPGLEKNTAFLHLGYGRSAGAVAGGVGVDGFKLMPKDGAKLVFAKVTLTGKATALASTQDHFSRPGNPFNEVSFADSTTYPADARERVLGTTFDGRKEQSPVVRMGKLTIYKEKGAGFAHEGDIPASLVAHNTPAHKPAKPLQPHKEVVYEGQQWGMVIDLSTCIGCNACSIACQAENNIPSVGRKQVLLGREMHWMRIDRYFHGDVENPESMHQPMNCMHCENAPCEPVCPVAATVHDEEGINSMAYNRCIGTRYCANNCPFKVRRFNYLDFTVTGNVYRDPEQVKRADVYKLQRNPNVTVRYRGVMEKCTYCTQRVETAKVAFKAAGGNRQQLPDGAVVPACAQTCPTGAITFGNINDEKSKVHELKKSDRNYELLQELNIRPRTTYLARLKNDNPELASSTKEG
ncbi:MAG: TAT-variant-translocated molybdopterin oxidoreductase [Deltaproteobacteria bacterium]|nr:TAT-variant-translocated molybdopterin oxidoreductase [Deltaproteobacteria bacterium]